MALMTVMALMSTTGVKGLSDPQRAGRNQETCCYLLYRYLCSNIGRANAVNLLPKYLYHLSELEEMAQILVAKTLNV